MYVVMMPFLKRWEGLYVCGLEDETQKQLSVSGAEVRKKGVPIKADLENLSEVQVSSIQVFLVIDIPQGIHRIFISTQYPS